MKSTKPILISTLTASLLILAGCTTQTATNTMVNDNATVEVVANTNETTSNENTNVGDASGEVDTSDWLTYTNDEYGFSFKYPKKWGEAVMTTREADEYQTGSITQIIFDNDRSRNGIEVTAVVKVETADYQFTGPADGENILFSRVDLTQTEDQLQESLKRGSTVSSVVTKVTTLNNIDGLIVDETVKSLGGEKQNYIEYLFPKFNVGQSLNMRIYGKKDIEEILELLVSSLIVSS